MSRTCVFLPFLHPSHTHFSLFQSCCSVRFSWHLCMSSNCSFCPWWDGFRASGYYMLISWWFGWIACEHVNPESVLKMCVVSWRCFRIDWEQSCMNEWKVTWKCLTNVLSLKAFLAKEIEDPWSPPETPPKNAVRHTASVTGKTRLGLKGRNCLSRISKVGLYKLI